MPFANKGVVLLDLSGSIKYASTYFCDLVGIEHSDVAGRSCFDFVFPEDLESAKKLLDESKLPDPAPFPLRMRRTDGAAIWVDVQAAPMKTASGEVYAVSATVTSLIMKNN
jgi:PAS domain S-box-containing protein